MNWRTCAAANWWDIAACPDASYHPVLRVNSVFGGRRCGGSTWYRDASRRVPGRALDRAPLRDSSPDLAYVLEANHDGAGRRSVHVDRVI